MPQVNKHNPIIANDRIIESIKVRGIASSITAMSYPSFKTLDELLKTVGYTIITVQDSNKQSS